MYVNSPSVPVCDLDIDDSELAADDDRLSAVGGETDPSIPTTSARTSEDLDKGMMHCIGVLYWCTGGLYWYIVSL